jgi:beta-galactosidase
MRKKIKTGTIIKGLALAILLIMIGVVDYSCNQASGNLPERMVSFNSNWKFNRNELEGAEQPAFEDSDWRILDVPHDWSIEDLPSNTGKNQVGPFTEDSQGGTSTGFVVGGVGWYRKSFRLDPSTINKKVQIYFDGVYMNSEVWINGHYLGLQPYGYSPFIYDLTSFLNSAGEENVLAVKVNNHGENSRWYSGSGIYRNVELIVTDKLHIPVWGHFITTPEVSVGKATVNISTSVLNETGKTKDIIVHTQIITPDGSVVGQTKSKTKLSASAEVQTDQQVIVNEPLLWSVDAPHLYQAVTTILGNGRKADQQTSTFGIRSIAFSADKGFLLNGEQVLMKGGCLHHDNGPIGAAAIDRAEERKVELMKQNGFNAIRTAHNLPSKAFLEACDRLGMLVIDEIFDQWQRPKKPEDYHLYFDEWHRHDLEAMVLRDRNHPSVIIWSIGNEISERADSSGLEITHRLSEIIKDLDDTRPVNAAHCGFWEQENRGKEWDITAAAFDLLDIAGYNYQWQKYESDHALYPDRIFIGTESFPMEAFENWQMVEKHSYVIGDFVWTGMDYMGEVGIGHSVTGVNPIVKPSPGWPWYNAYCGDIDICGFKKPQSYFRDVVWKISNLEMAVHKPVPPGMKTAVSRWGWPDEYQSWNWQGHEGEILVVAVYSNYQEVRLEVNGKIIGTQKVSDENKRTARFKVPYEAGELRVIGYNDGAEAEVKSLKTVGKPANLRLTADRASIRANRNDLAYITVEITDESGAWVPDANFQVNFEVSGVGELVAVENGKPDGVKSFQVPFVDSFNGRCLAILRSTEGKGEIRLKAFSDGLETTEITIRAL